MAKTDPIIETGVDKLVVLIGSKKKISLKDAAKTLNVGVNVIEEWADFLEEEGAISINYGLTNTYLEERKLSEKEITRKAKDFHNRKDAFTRKVEGTITVIDKEAENLAKFKEHFSSLKKELGDDFKFVKSELTELGKLQKLKNDVDVEFHSQQKDFVKKIESMDKILAKERDKYKQILEDIDEEKELLNKEKNVAKNLKQKEIALYEKLESFNKLIKNLAVTIEDEDKRVEIIEGHIGKLESLANTVRGEVISNKEKLDNMITDNRNNENKILKIQNEIMEKVKMRKKEIEDTMAESQKASNRFKTFFTKKDDIDKLVSTIEKQILDLKHDMDKIITKTKTFSIASKNTDVKAHIKRLEKKLKEAEKKRDAFRTKMKKLTKIIHG